MNANTPYDNLQTMLVTWKCKERKQEKKGTHCNLDTHHLKILISVLIYR